MDLTPRDIQDKQFHDGFRGYNHEEVDMFLDDVALSFEKVFRENQTLHHRVQELEQQLSQAQGTEDMLKRTLLTAQKTAEEAVEEARQKAQGMITTAERRSQEIVATAERRSQEILAQAVNKEREMQVGLEGLKRFEAEYTARLRAFIESQLQVLEEGPAAPPDLEVVRRPVTPPPAVEEEVAVPEEPADQAVEVLPEVEVSIPEPDAALARQRASTRPVGRSDESSPHPAPAGEDDDEKKIKELFWGDE